jgi:predicted glycoside hydrolase/deacetylase ChbG (UPF0249 family)
MKQLIVTADDFGYSRHVNKAIIKCFKEGIVTSTSLLANTRYFDESAKLLKQNRKLDIGIHINLTEFSTLTNSKTLTDKNGKFIKKIKWFDGYYKNADKNEIEKEIEAQIAKAISSGLKLTHINGHNHIHIFPKVIDIVVKLAKKHKISYIRLPDEREVAINKLSSEIKKRNIIPKFSKSAKSKIIKNKLKATGAFYGIFNINDMDFYKLPKILRSINNGTSELMVHPAYIDRKGDIFHQSKQREKEIQLLTNNKIKQLVKKREINLTNFSQI